MGGILRSSSAVNKNRTKSSVSSAVSSAGVDFTFPHFHFHSLPFVALSLSATTESCVLPYFLLQVLLFFAASSLVSSFPFPFCSPLLVCVYIQSRNFRPHLLLLCLGGL